MSPICPYCNLDSVLVTGADIYRHRLDLAHKAFYRCPQCGAYVGCHPGTTRPLGRLANAELRAAKSAAHEAFDPKWKSGEWGNRRAAYSRLAGLLGIPESECHIGMFDLDRCRQVVALCKAPQASGAE